MPLEKKTLNKFRRKFDQQRSDRFLVTIEPSDTLLPKFSEQVNELKAEGAGANDCPKIEQYQVLNITIPTFEFQKEHEPDGILVKSYPVMKFEGFSFPILFQEDRYGTISRFVNWCQKRIIHSSGQYYHPEVSKIGNISIEIIGWDNKPIMRYVMERAYFLGQTPVTLDYSNGVPLPISITFGADYFRFESEYSNETFD